MELKHYSERKLKAEILEVVGRLPDIAVQPFKETGRLNRLQSIFRQSGLPRSVFELD